MRVSGRRKRIISGGIADAEIFKKRQRSHDSSAVMRGYLWRPAFRRQSARAEKVLQQQAVKTRSGGQVAIYEVNTYVSAYDIPDDAGSGNSHQ